MKSILRFFAVVLCALTLWAGACSAEGLPWKPSEKEGTFLMVSDIHFDPYADPSIVKQLAAAPVEHWKSIFESSAPAPFSAYGKDTNYPLLKSFLEEAAGLGDFDYVLVSGDFISHEFKAAFTKDVNGDDKDDKAYRDFVLKTVVFVSRMIQDDFPGKPVYFCLGNNDSDCDDYGGVVQGTPFLPTLAKEWATVARDPEAQRTFMEGGYYVVPHPTLKGRLMVVFNDVSWSKKYAPACSDTLEIGKGEMDWLSGVLQQARTQKERITLLTHMPPGIHSRNASEHPDRTSVKPQHTLYAENYLWPFLNLLAPCRDLIDGEFCGHTHLDDFRLVQDRGGKPVFFTHISPAVSPVHNNNPGFQVMLYNKLDGTYEDMATYYLPLDRKEGAQPAAPPWALEYSFREAYGAKAYDFQNLKAVAEAIEADPEVRKKFVGFATQESQHDPVVTGDNWKFFGCAHLNLDPKSYMDCYR